MLTIYWVRHGEAEGNVENKIMGQSDHHLTASGEDNAKSLGEKLKFIKFDSIYSSDLRRAYETAVIISKSLDFPLEPEKAEKLREIDPGECCGMELERFSREYPEAKCDVDFCFPKGESYKVFFRRVADFLEILGRKHDHGTILIVAHEGVVKATEYYFGCFEFCDHRKIQIPHEYIGKCIIDAGDRKKFDRGIFTIRLKSL